MSTREQKIEAVLDVLAPVSPAQVQLGEEWPRSAIFEWGHETTPTRAEIYELAGRVVDALAAVD